LDTWSSPASNGDVVIGVRSALTVPPEMVAVTLASNEKRVLTDLNPALRQIQYGDISEFKWNNGHDAEASGFLIKPLRYRPGVRYPLVILLPNGNVPEKSTPYILDAALQLNGHAIQMLASEGFVVLYPRNPSVLRGFVGTPQEGRRVRDHIDAAIAELDRQGVIDTAHIGISGWSRSAYLTDYVVMNSRFRFAAASTMDGGSMEYTDGLRPYKDEELARFRTPLLTESYDRAQLALTGAFLDRLEAMGVPVEMMYYATAPHSLVRPQHRKRSLETHLDWWSFWLKGVERQGIGDTEQYPRWRKYRQMMTEHLQKAGATQTQTTLR
jgi:dipeptidyl aminopeptidase/acylaminoacyl peptidase